MNCDKCCGNCKWKYIEGENDCFNMPNDGFCVYWEETESGDGR